MNVENFSFSFEEWLDILQSVLVHIDQSTEPDEHDYWSKLRLKINQYIMQLKPMFDENDIKAIRDRGLESEIAAGVISDVQRVNRAFKRFTGDEWPRDYEIDYRQRTITLESHKPSVIIKIVFERIEVVDE